MLPIKGLLLNRRIKFLDSLDIADERVTGLITKLKGTQKFEYPDPLKKFKIKPAGGGVASSGLDKAAARQEERLRKQREREFNDLVASLRTEEEVIQESYERRLQIILQNTEEGSRQQHELKARLDRDFASQVLDDFRAEPTSFEAKEAALIEEFERRRQIILDNTRLTEEQRTEIEEELTKERNERLAALESERIQFTLQASTQLFDGLAGLAKTFAGEQSGIFKVMFAASKAFAIADAVMKIQQGIASAASLPWPANLGAIASTVAATASVVSTIQSTQMQLSGAYDHGGMIPAGKVGLVGEYGPELVSGPAMVTSRRTTADGGSSAAGQKGVTVIVNNHGSDTATTREYDDGNGKVIEVLIQKTKQAIAQDFREGGGSVSRAAEGAYGLRRGVA